MHGSLALAVLTICRYSDLHPGTGSAHTEEAEAGGLHHGQALTSLNSELKSSQGYTVRLRL